LLIVDGIDDQVANQAAGFLTSKLDEPLGVVDRVSLVMAASILQLTHGHDLFEGREDAKRGIIDFLETHRSGDGGYAKMPGGVAGSTYQTFLNLLCFELLEHQVEGRDRIAKFLDSQRMIDGGFREIRVAKRAGVNPTAAVGAEPVGELRPIDASGRRGAKGRRVSWFCLRPRDRRRIHILWIGLGRAGRGASGRFRDGARSGENGLSPIPSSHSPPPRNRGMHELKVESIHKSYRGGGEPLHVLRDLSLTLSRGDSLAVVGPSGSGKSTLLQILGTLDRPDSGKVEIAGTDPFVLDERELAEFRNAKIGFVFQDHHLLPQLTLLENVLIPALARGTARAEDYDRAQELIARVGLEERTQHRPSQLSGGERERVAIARALFHDPVLILADEPTGNLDRRTAEKITALLLELQANSGAMLIAVTHSDSLAAAMGRRAELVDGKLAF
jgi:lipoprotein-releasing system ATP-binding protein